jgi:hypothetical protein
LTAETLSGVCPVNTAAPAPITDPAGSVQIVVAVIVIIILILLYLIFNKIQPTTH